MPDQLLNPMWGSHVKFRVNDTGKATGLLQPESTSELAFGLGNVEAISAGRALTTSDNGTTFVCSSTPQFTVPTYLQPGFFCRFKAACTFSGAEITDVRTTGAANPWCELIQTSMAVGSQTYDVVGTKA